MRKAVLLSAMMISIVFVPMLSATATDGDLDGVLDSADMCPFAYGNATSSNGLGCPDSDGDGMADFEQPTVYNWDTAIKETEEQGHHSGGVSATIWALNNTGYFTADVGGNNPTIGTVHFFDKLGVHVSMVYNSSSKINQLAISPDGSMLAVAGDSGVAMIINSTTGNEIVNLVTTSENVDAIEWSNSGHQIFTYSGNDTMTGYNTTTWHPEFNLSIPPVGGWVTLAGIDTTPDDRLIAMGIGPQVLVYWLSNLTFYGNHSSHSESIMALQISPDGRYIATGSWDNTARIFDIKNKTVIKTINPCWDVADVEFSKDGGTIVLACAWDARLKVYDVETWNETGRMTGFGNQNNNRGVWSIAFDDSGMKLAVGWRRGYVSLHMVPDAYIRVQGDFYTELMNSSWKSGYYHPDNSLLVESNDRNSVTIDICDSKSRVGSFTVGVSPAFATKDANYSSNGIWDCKNTQEKILEIPFGRAAGVFMVKAGGDTQTCVETLGGLSMAQVRWLTSGSSKNQLTSNGEMPGLKWNSVVPNDDLDGIAEWSDLHSSCPDDEIVLSHRTGNRTDITILEETVLCTNCANPDSFYQSSDLRYRAIAGEYRSDVTLGVAAGSGEGSIGFTELMFAVEDQQGIYLVPLVDNYTHGIMDAVADGGVIINASENASISGEWPLQTNMRAFVAGSELSRNFEFLSFLLSEIGQMKWEQMGFTRLGVYDLYLSWLRLGVDKSYLLPDADQDGVWDGADQCPDSDLNFTINEYGCAENQLDNDGDGYTNDIDDCENVTGESTFGKIGCLDDDGDGWPNDLDSHPTDQSEWNDTDLDGFGDNSDDCIDSYGNSTQDRFGCLDSDGDGWSDENDAFTNDSSEWVDSDGDLYGDNSDKFPYEITQWNDTDMDGFGDNETGIEGDDCIEVYGESFKDGIFGCLDTDNDGWADEIDDLPNDPLQHKDKDGDGVGDDAIEGDYDWCPETPVEELSMINSIGCSPSERDSDYDTFNDAEDMCLETPFSESGKIDTRRTIDTENGTVANPYLGCAPIEVDADNDGYSLQDDWNDNDASQWFDTDGDGFGDNSDGTNGDDCPTSEGTSFKDKFGCIDLDNDGWSYQNDFNDADPTQWNDSDGDGFGDNWDNPEWNSTRTLGEFVKGATQPDRCPEEYSNFIYDNTQGCLTAEQNPNDKNEDSTSSSGEGESNIGLIIGIAAAGIIMILFGSIAVLMKKQPKGKKKGKRKQSSRTVEQEVIDSIEIPQDSDFVSSWEDLPDGEWLDNDENGVNWYKDIQGRHWYSDEGGFRIWKD